MGAELFELIHVFLVIEILALGGVEFPQALHFESLSLPLKIVHVLINRGPCGQVLVDAFFFFLVMNSYVNLCT